jgi:hypothetical protein
MGHDMLALLASQGKPQKRLVVELMPLLEVLQKGCQAGLITLKTDWERKSGFSGCAPTLGCFTLTH